MPVDSAPITARLRKPGDLRHPPTATRVIRPFRLRRKQIPETSRSGTSTMRCTFNRCLFNLPFFTMEMVSSGMRQLPVFQIAILQLLVKEKLKTDVPATIFGDTIVAADRLVAKALLSN